MTSPSVKVLGAYRVECTPELIAEAMRLKYEGCELQVDEQRQAEEIVREELSNVVLLETLVSNPDKRFDIGDFTQAGSEQAPYDEYILSEDGSKVVSDDSDTPTSGLLRISFFLHYFDPDEPLITSYGPVDVPAIQLMPSRLQNLVPYEPVD